MTGGTYVAVGVTSGVATSPDGINWTAGTIPYQNWYSVAYGAGLFVAIGGTGTSGVATSPDGITWTYRSLPPPSQSWNAVTYGGGMFVAVALGPTTVAASSPDGITWTARTMPSSLNWTDVTYGTYGGGARFMAVAGPSGSVATSPDGITWTLRAMGVASQTWSSVAYGNNTFVAVCGGTSAYSSDGGVTWALKAPSSHPWSAIAYGAGMFVAVATGPTTVAASNPDMSVAWASRTLPSSHDWNGVGYCGGMFVAVATGPYGATSPDGINWTAMTMPSGGYLWYSVAYGPVVAASGGASLALSGSATGVPRGGNASLTLSGHAGAAPSVAVATAALSLSAAATPAAAATTGASLSLSGSSSAPGATASATATLTLTATAPAWPGRLGYASLSLSAAATAWFGPSVVFGATYLSLARDGTVRMALSTQAVEHTPAVNVDVRPYAGGNFRMVTTPGVQKTVKVTASFCNDVQVAQLKAWLGTLLCLRDGRSEKLYGFYKDATFAPRTLPNSWAVSFSFQQVSFSEYV